MIHKPSRIRKIRGRRPHQYYNHKLPIKLNPTPKNKNKIRSRRAKRASHGNS